MASRKGLMSSGLVWSGLKLDRDDVHPHLLAQRAEHHTPRRRRWVGVRDPSRFPPGAKTFRAWLRAPSIPPASQPSVITTAFMAPALAPVIASKAQAAVLEEGVEHPPREGAVRPAPLQGERHRLLGARTCNAARSPIRLDVGRRRSSCRPVGSSDDVPCPGHVSLLKGGGVGGRVNLTDRHAAATTTRELSARQRCSQMKRCS